MSRESCPHIAHISKAIARPDRFSQDVGRHVVSDQLWTGAHMVHRFLHRFAERASTWGRAIIGVHYAAKSSPYGCASG